MSNILSYSGTKYFKHTFKNDHHPSFKIPLKSEISNPILQEGPFVSYTFNYIQEDMVNYC